MTMPRRGGARPAAAPLPFLAVAVVAVAVLALVLAACGNEQATATPRPSGADGSPAASDATPGPTATPAPTPLPTPTYTNPPDPALAELVPTQIAGVTVHVPSHDEFALTPGDFGAAAYGDLGLRFATLQLAYVEQPRTSLYAARVNGEPVTTEELEPYLATAGREVGINGLHREPWELKTIEGRVTWVRPEDNATAAGTMIYTWASDQYVFLLIGVDDSVNQALFAALPGEAAPTPTPRPSRTPAASTAPTGSAEASAAGS